MQKNSIYLNIEKNLFRIGNDLIERELIIEDGFLYTKKLINKLTNTNLVKGISKEFEFTVDDRTYSTKDFEYSGYEKIDFFDTKRLIIELKSKDEILIVRLFYEVYIGYAITRKWLEISNNSNKEIRVNNLAWEKLIINSGKDLDVYHNYLSQKGENIAVAMKDCVIAAHDSKNNEGFLVATEAAGVLKQIELLKNDDYLTVMFNNSYQTIFEKFLSPNEVFKTPESFILLYHNKEYNNVIDNEFISFLENKIIKTECEKIPSVTWFSWDDDVKFGIDEKYIENSINIAKEIGIDCILIDAGWYDYIGDFNVNTNKFPKGLEYLSKKIHENGMKLGLWISISTVDIDSRILKEHPEWAVRDKNGKMVMHINKHISMCLDTDYKYYIADKMKYLIRKFNIDLLKIDFTTVRNVYFPKYNLGCCATNHNHKTQNESFYNNNEAILQIFNDVRVSEKHCILSFSFEAYGVPIGIDIAQLKVSHTNWIVSSYTQPDYARRIMFQRSRVVPSYCISLHATNFNDDNLDYCMLSNMITGIVATGNLMRLNKDMVKKDRIKYWLNWLNAYRKKNDFYKYNKVSDIFNAPNTSDAVDWEKYVKNYEYENNYYGIIAIDEWHDLHELIWGEKFTEKEWIEWIKNEKVAYIESIATSNIPDINLKRTSSNWDGTAKLNKEGEGVILIFRPENNNEDYKIFKIPWLLSNIDYRLKNINIDKEIGIYNSMILKNEGLKIYLNKKEAVLITIEKI